MKKYMSLLLGLLCTLSTMAGTYDTTKSYTGSFSLSSWTSSNQGYDNTTSSLTINFSCNERANLSFSYKVSSEKEYDTFSITLDGVTLIKDVSGEVSNSYSNTNLSAGQHTLVFTYSKNYIQKSGDDQVTVSNIKLIELSLPWEAPTPKMEKGIPPYGTDILLKLVNKDMYLSKGTTWGTHATLTRKPEDALVYQLENYNGHNRFHSDGAGNKGYLFIAGLITNTYGYYTGNVYVDYDNQDISYTYFGLKTSGDGFTINIPQSNAWWSYGNLADSPGLGWNLYNQDLDEYDNKIGSNVGIFMLGNGTGYENKWQYCEVEHYNARLALYEELVNAYINSETIIQAASDTYNKDNATTEELQYALDLQRNGGQVLEDYTGWIVNPNIDGNTHGWTVDMPSAQNKGYQDGKAYTNGSVQINRFIESWIVKPNYLGAGEISQSISGLPDGVYKFEADAIATDQSGYASPSTGVYLFAESDIMAQTSVSSANEKPEHFALTFVKAGNDLKLGLRTDADCTANWIAFDNVTLKRVGDIESDATAVSVSPSSLNLIVGETGTLTANVTASKIYQAVTWTSDNEEVATVDHLGNVAAHKSGTAHITATAVGTSLTASCTVTVGINDISALVINEVQAINLDKYLDPSFNYGGWIEIYNRGLTPANLGGAIICDATDKTKRFQLPTEVGVVPARGYLNIWFDHNAADGDYGGKSENQVNFKLSAEGGTICLLDGDGNEVSSATYPVPTPRCSYARTTDGGDTWGTTATPTPMQSNAGSTFATERTASPIISSDGKIFDKEDNIRFTVTVPAGSTLLYTTDGSAPSYTREGATQAYSNTSQKSQDYTFSTGGVTTIYRFCLVQDGKLPSPVVTRSFIQKTHDYYLPVLSVTSDPENLFGDDHGIYTSGVNGSTGNGISDPSNTNRDWERPVNMEYMVPETNSNGERSFITYVNQETDMEIAGGWTRNYYGGYVDGNDWFSRPSFRLKCDKRYEGVNSIDYPVFDHKPYNKYKVWQVRNGGNDRTNINRFKDALLNEMVLSTGFYVDAQDWQPTHVFLNGRYVGVFNVRESNNRHYGDSNYGMDTDEMDQFDLSNARYNQKVGDAEAWNELVALSAELASSQSEAIYAEILKRIDLDEYLNYMALECYISSSDWLTNRNNFKGFRSRTDDGKFHFVFFDADQAFGTSNMLGQLLNNDISGIDVDDLFRNLMQYDPIRRQFIDAHCIVGGSVMTPEIANDAFNKVYGKLNEAMTWEGGDGFSSAANYVINNYKGYPMYYLSNQFGLGEVYDLTLSSNIPGAQLSLNGQQIPRAQFAGYAYNSGNGIHLTAKAPAGYRFLGWQQDGAKSEGTSTTTTLIDFRAENWITSDYGVSRDGEDWTSVTYPETGWANLDAPFGFASNDDKFMKKDASTVLEPGTPRIPTYYFRHKFWFNKVPAAGSKLVFKYKIDDGFRAYINGKDIGGRNIDMRNVGYSNYTDNAAYAGDAPLEGTLEIPIEDLNLDFKGSPNNVLSVLLKNCSSTSSDVYFDCSLEVVETSEGGSENYISTDETFCLNEVESAGAYTITACYEKIDGECERWEAGATPIRINEVSAGNDIYINEHSKKSDWIELYNTTDEPIDLTGLYLSDNARKPQKWQIAASAVTDPLIIPAHGTRIVWCDDLEPLTQLHAPFKLSNADGASVSIQATDGRWQDRLEYEEQPRWTTYGRYPDGGNHTQLMAQPTIDKSNRLGSYDFTAVAPEEFLDEDVTITLALEEGWNWSSHNLASSVHPSRFTTYADILRGQTTELYKDPEIGWTGLLSALEPTLGYKLHMNERADVTLRGKPFDAQTDIELKKGWNWVAFPLLNATTLELATRDFIEGGAPTGLRIVGQDFSTILSGGEWKGSLTVLQPGQAYLIYTGTATTLRWTTGSSSRSLRARRYAPLQNELVSPWAFNLHAYPNVMPVTAEFNMDDRDTYRLLTDLQAEGQHYYLGAFSGDECRGIAVIDDDRLYMNVHGEGGEPITFRLLTDEGDLYTAAQQPTMESLFLLGDYDEPYRLSFTSSSLTDVVQPMQSAQRVVSTEYYNLAGQRILQPAGISIMRQRLADGTIRTRKLK